VGASGKRFDTGIRFNIDIFETNSKISGFGITEYSFKLHLLYGFYMNSLITAKYISLSHDDANIFPEFSTDLICKTILPS